MAAEDDERGSVFSFAEYPQSMIDLFDVVGIVQAQDIPMITEEPRRHILGERKLGAAFNGDVIVIIDPAKIIKAKMASQ